MEELKFADVCNGETNFSVDSLVGADICWNLLDGDIQREASDPVALIAKFGSGLPGLTCTSSSRPHHATVNLMCTSSYNCSNIYLLTCYPVGIEKYQARSHIVRT